MDESCQCWADGFSRVGSRTGQLTCAIMSSDGKYMFDERPENRPAAPMMTTTTHFNEGENTLYGSSSFIGFQEDVGRDPSSDGVADTLWSVDSIPPLCIFAWIFGKISIGLG